MLQRLSWRHHWLFHVRGHQHGCDLIRRCKKCVPVWHPNGTFSLFNWFHTYFILWCVGSLADFYHWMSNLWNFEHPQRWELPRHGASKKRWTGCISLLQLTDAVYFLAFLAPKYFCRPTIMRHRRSSHRIDESKRCNKLAALILSSMRHLGFLIKKLVPDDCVVQAPIKKGGREILTKLRFAMRRWALFLSGLWGFCRQITWAYVGMLLRLVTLARVKVKIEILPIQNV